MINKKLVKSAILFLTIAFSYNGYSIDKQATDNQTTEVQTTNEDKEIKEDKLSSFPISLSNNLSEISSDVALSSVGLVSYINNKNETLLGRLGVLYSGFYISVLNRSIGGHIVKIKEFGYKVKKTEFSLSDIDVVYEANLDTDFIQKQSILSMGGTHANNLLSHKIAWNLISEKREIDNVSAAAYIFSSQDQARWAYLKKVNPSHDLNNHVRFMQELYGKDSINMDKIKSVVFLDLLDPILFASIYSTATGEAVKIPALNIGNGISITPKMNVILTPYGVVEKRVTAYINTNYTPIMVSFGFGKEQKTDKPYYEYSSYKRYINNLDFMCKINPSDSAKQAERRYAGTIYNHDDNKSLFEKDLKSNETYYFEIKIGKIAGIGKFSVGASLVTWNQPELFTKKPRYAKMKKGYFGSVDFNHETNDHVNFFGSIGYKTKGFMIGKPVKKTPLISAGLRLMI